MAYKISNKQKTINEMQKYPSYAVPSRKYLHSLKEEELNRQLQTLKEIFDKK